MSTFEDKKFLSFLGFKKTCDLNLAERKVLSFLVWSAGGKMDLPSVTAISKGCGMTRNTASKHMESLAWFLRDDKIDLSKVDSVVNRKRAKNDKTRNRYVCFRMYVRKSRSPLSNTSIAVLSYILAHNDVGFGRSMSPAYIASVLGVDRHTVSNAIAQLAEYQVWNETHDAVQIDVSVTAIDESIQITNEVYKEKKLMVTGVQAPVKPKENAKELAKKLPESRTRKTGFAAGLPTVRTEFGLFELVYKDDLLPLLEKKGVVGSGENYFDDLKVKFELNVPKLRQFISYAHKNDIDVDKFLAC